MLLVRSGILNVVVPVKLLVVVDKTIVRGRKLDEVLKVLSIGWYETSVIASAFSFLFLCTHVHDSSVRSSSRY